MLEPFGALAGRARIGPGTVGGGVTSGLDASS
jgi:hypothetical protein